MSDEQAKAIQETSKAVQEVAKTTSTAIDAIQAFFSTLFGEYAVEIGHALGDRARVWRCISSVRLAEKTRKKFEAMGLTGKQIEQIPLRQLLPLLDKATLEDDESLQEMWAGLIVNSAVADAAGKHRKLYINILSELEPLDGLILQCLNSNSLTGSEPSRGYSEGEISSYIRINGPDSLDQRHEITLSLENLHRLGCIIEDRAISRTDIRLPPSATLFKRTTIGFDVNSVKVDASYYKITNLGNALLKECMS